jgi:hypothetical protein
MVDGDPQQRAELSSKAILDYMPNDVDSSCGWHIMEQGGKAHGPRKTAVKDDGDKQDKCNLFQEARKRLMPFLDEPRWGQI